MVFVYYSAYGIAGFNLFETETVLMVHKQSAREIRILIVLMMEEEGVGMRCHDGAELLLIRDVPVQRSLVIDGRTSMVICRFPYIHVRFLMIVH